MKFAGTYFWFVGSWIMLTMFVAALRTNYLPYAQRLESVAPYTGLLVGAIGLCVLGQWLYDKRT